MNEWEELQESVGFDFKNIELLQNAFTHSSYVNEHRHENLKDNERLEFLGDAVLELTVSDYLFNKYPDMAEGQMTKMRAAIVCEPSLVEFAEMVHFSKYIRLGKGEEKAGGRTRPALLADVFESFIGALYLDNGIQAVIRFLERLVFPKIDTGIYMQTVDFKTQLQEIVQRDRDVLIQYDILGETGPAHNKAFEAQVVVNGQVLGKGTGRTKKQAEQNAAEYAIRQVLRVD
ncbi:ribonuclease III [Listeria fleischmannii]|uniref:Ribonuclease 3 n=2 Tax=Listeria fleischmannii TaxID=1069827 RepID=W7DFA9_9LIST|nr:ribonuclease III [Listeria fleischmannii]EIA19595.1 ribonuclease III [Listeria fleischmannii subsp. coloradonensis]EUJ48028.1 ribonuclease III [Listeria fleischmannii FSL S10-1203]MBC1399519.1 ribonuclease III [Listeria fleischmannii]MBC1418886.1 ribonuclease III [Listeria fleischmannii]MBC1428217.1 ribonuclease III [Listeria fleischmannii]